MSLIGKEMVEFQANAYHKGEFIEISSEDFKGKWNIVCFYPADFTFVCPTELEDLQDQYATLQDLGVEVILCQRILTLLIKHGTTIQTQLAKLNIS